MADRHAQYKNQGKDSEALRKNRIDNTINLRKERREEALSETRNISAALAEEDNDAGNVPPPVYDKQQLQQIVAHARSPDPETQMNAVTQVRKLLLSDRNPPIDDLIESEILPILVKCLKSNNSSLQFEAAWALTNIASGTSKQTKAVVEAGPVPYFLELLKSPNLNVCEQAVWVFRNISGDGPHFRDYCIQLGIVELLVKIVNLKNPLKFLKNVSWVIVNLCRSELPPPSREIVLSLLSVMAVLIKHQDATILVCTALALSNLAKSGNEQIQLVIDSGVVWRLLDLLSHAEVKVQNAALKAIGHIVTGTDEQTQLVLDNGALFMMHKLLIHRNDKINRYSLWFLSNITAGNELQVQAVINAGLVPQIIGSLIHNDFEAVEHAICAISNITINGRVEHVLYMVDKEVIIYLSFLIRRDAAKIRDVLAICRRILKKCGERKEEVRYHLRTYQLDSIGWYDVWGV